MFQEVQHPDVVENKTESNNTQTQIGGKELGISHQERLAFERLQRTRKTRYWPFSQKDSELSDAVAKDADQVVFSGEEEVRFDYR